MAKFATLDDLGIDYSDHLTNPEGFLQRMYDAGMKLYSQLESTKTQLDIEKDAIEKAKLNFAANQRARVLLDDFIDAVLKEDTDVIGNIVSMLPEIGKAVNEVFRGNLPHSMSRYEIHQLYVKLSDAHATYSKFAVSFLPELMSNKLVKQLPKKSGNYLPKVDHRYPIFRYFVDGSDDYMLLPFQVARKLGIVIKDRMELHEMVKSGEVTRVRIEQA